MTTSPPPLPERPRPRWPRRVFVTFIITIGICQALTTTPSLDIDMLPQWLGGVDSWDSQG